MPSARYRWVGRLRYDRKFRHYSLPVVARGPHSRSSHAPRAPSRPRPAPVPFWQRKWQPRRLKSAKPPRWLAPLRERQRRYLRAVAPRSLRAASVPPVLRYGRAPRALGFLDASLSHGELRRTTNDAQVSPVRAARPWTTFSAGTRPYRTGKRCYTAVHRYTRYRASPMDGPARLPQSPGTTGRPASSNSST